MLEILLDNIFSFVFGIMVSAIIFWLTASKKITNIENKLNEQSKYIHDIENKYQKGYTPEYLCESCHKGRYSYKGLVTRGMLTIEQWICDQCNEEAPLSWINRNNARK